MCDHNKTILVHVANIGWILVAKEPPKLGELFKKARVKRRTYAEEFVERIYAFFVGNAIDLKNEYCDYYKDEYTEFSDFLFHKYGMCREDIHDLAKAIKSNRYLGLVNQAWGKDYLINSLMESEGGMDIIMAALNATCKEVKDEDQI